jgi:hypothetical protein
LRRRQGPGVHMGLLRALSPGRGSSLQLSSVAALKISKMKGMLMLQASVSRT